MKVSNKNFTCLYWFTSKATFPLFCHINFNMKAIYLFLSVLLTLSEGYNISGCKLIARMQIFVTYWVKTSHIRTQNESKQVKELFCYPRYRSSIFQHSENFGKMESLLLKKDTSLGMAAQTHLKCLCYAW